MEFHLEDLAGVSFEFILDDEVRVIGAKIIQPEGVFHDKKK